MPKISTSPGKILIIEDEAFLSEMYKTKFEALGYEVRCQENGEEGLKSIHDFKPDIVLLDILMPVMDGYDVLKALRSDDDIKDTLVVIFSNLGQEEEITKGMQLGADDYLVKSSLTPAELVEKVKRVLSRGRSDKSETVPSIRVLLIEDTQDLIELYSKRFEQEGFDYRVAENGAWGLKLAQTAPFDVILLDLAMPQMNGLEALRTMRETPKLKDMPIIVFSNSVAADEIEEIKKEGATEVFLKARVTPMQLMNRIREAVEEGR